MADATAPASIAPAGPMLAADGTPLKVSLRRALRAQKLRALLLVAPLLVFILVTFLLPIGDMLFRSVENQIVPNTLPRTVEALESWDAGSGEAPDEPVYAALHADLLVAIENRVQTRVGSRLNYENPGISSLFRRAGRDVPDMDPSQPLKPQFLESNAGWGDPAIWSTFKLYSGDYTDGYFLNAVDTRDRARDALYTLRHRNAMVDRFARFFVKIPTS